MNAEQTKRDDHDTISQNIASVEAALFTAQSFAEQIQHHPDGRRALTRIAEAQFWAGKAREDIENSARRAGSGNPLADFSRSAGGSQPENVRLQFAPIVDNQPDVSPFSADQVVDLSQKTPDYSLHPSWMTNLMFLPSRRPIDINSGGVSSVHHLAAMIGCHLGGVIVDGDKEQSTTVQVEIDADYKAFIDAGSTLNDAGWDLAASVWDRVCNEVDEAVAPYVWPDGFLRFVRRVGQDETIEVYKSHSITIRLKVYPPSVGGKGNATS